MRSRFLFIGAMVLCTTYCAFAQQRVGISESTAQDPKEVVFTFKRAEASKFNLERLEGMKVMLRYDDKSYTSTATR